MDELTVHQTINQLPQPDGSTTYQNGLGKTYYRDEVVPDDKIAEDWSEAIDAGDSARLPSRWARSWRRPATKAHRLVPGSVFRSPATTTWMRTTFSTP